MDDKRDRPGWEPPPWEAEAFEVLQRRREEQDADAEIAKALDELGSSERPAAAPPPRREPAVPAQEVQAHGAAAPGRPDAQDEARIETMLIGLRAEEPKAVGRVWVVGVVTAVFLISGGLVLAVLGGAAALRTGRTPAGLVGSLILLAFGGVLLGLGVWLVQRTLKVKGVM